MATILSYEAESSSLRSLLTRLQQSIAPCICFVENSGVEPCWSPTRRKASELLTELLGACRTQQKIDGARLRTCGRGVSVDCQITLLTRALHPAMEACRVIITGIQAAKIINIPLSSQDKVLLCIAAATLAELQKEQKLLVKGVLG